MGFLLGPEGVLRRGARRHRQHRRRDARRHAARADRGARRRLHRRPHEPVPALAAGRRRIAERCASDPNLTLFGSNYQDIFAFIVLILVLVVPAVGPARRARRATGPDAMRLHATSIDIRTGRARLGVALIAHRAARAAVRARAASAPPGCASRTSRSSTSCSRSGLNIVVGFAGLLDLGYIAFYAVGAYIVRAARLAALRRCTCPFWADPADRRARSRCRLRRAARRADAEAARRLPRDRHARLRRDHPHLPEQPVAAGQHHQRPARASRRSIRSTSAAFNFGNDARRSAALDVSAVRSSTTTCSSCVRASS